MENLVIKKINDLVSEDDVFGYVLHYFGVSFHDYPVNTLEEVCKQRGLYLRQLEHSQKSIQFDTIVIYFIEKYLYGWTTTASTPLKIFGATFLMIL